MLVLISLSRNKENEQELQKKKIWGHNPLVGCLRSLIAQQCLVQTANIAG